MITMFVETTSRSHHTPSSRFSHTMSTQGGSGGERACGDGDGSESRRLGRVVAVLEVARAQGENRGHGREKC